MGNNPQEILDRRFNDQDTVLNPNQSITLPNHCAKLSEKSAESAAEKAVVVFLGSTGVRESTALNALMGCHMRVVSTKELGLIDTANVVTVDPKIPRDEVMPIGRSNRLQAFMPQVAHDSNNVNKTSCGCPRFSDKRGVSLANVVNIRKVRQQANNVKVMPLENYDFLFIHHKRQKSLAGHIP